MQILKSELISVPHGFFSRLGGISNSPYDSLNTSFSAGDESSQVTHNLELICATFNRTRDSLVTVNQVHGDRVVEAPFAQAESADAIFTKQKHLALGIRTADCVPVLIQDVLTSQVAAVHAGWKGVIANIAIKTVNALVKNGSRHENLRVAIGPAIQKCCFEVDGDLPQKFANQFGAKVLIPAQTTSAKAHIDLSLSLKISLLEIGIQESQIDILNVCTHCRIDFFSHRRDFGVTGRQLSVICCE